MSNTRRSCVLCKPCRHGDRHVTGHVTALHAGNEPISMSHTTAAPSGGQNYVSISTVSKHKK